ncbi:MAG: hypothetical protein JNK29_15315 [Anaerolineales bacterium]|nr:hypothetical protein [Anaerolineales bacterium]
MPEPTPADIQSWLREGLQAARAGDRSRARRRLLDVVRADARNEPAWLWLSDLLDDPADRIMALENALALNPANAAARQRLIALEAEVGQTPPPPAAPPPASPTPFPPELPPLAPEAEPEPGLVLTTGVDPDDDPLQCPFCGELTAEVDDRCPHCRRSLLAPGAWQSGIYLYLLLILLGLGVQAALLEGVLPLVLVALPGANLQRLLDLAGLGDGLVSVPFAVLFLRFVLLGGALALFLTDAQPAYLFGAAVLTLDVAAHLAAAWFGWLPARVLVVNLVLSAAALLLILAAFVSQGLARRRLFMTLDRDLAGGLSFYQRGQEHLRVGRVALAAAHLQKAVVLEPKAIGYYKDLAAVQARLGRWRKARQTLLAGRQRAPEDPDFARLLAEVERRL